VPFDGYIAISIHTPAQGVTTEYYDFVGTDAISIHTPAQGVTAFLKMILCFSSNFNPHSRTGSDSTDADKEAAEEYFNPHSRTGSDSMDNVTLTLFTLFQSTLPHRE